MRRTTITLSDGRELIYFDRDDSPARAGVDERGLPQGSTQQGSMRLDALTGDWISIAGHRQTRIFLPSASECPICPTTPGNLSEIPEPTYDVVVFENRFPSFLYGDEIGDTGDLSTWDAELPAHGRCEVVVFSDDHAGSIASIDTERMRLVMAAWIDRTRELSAMEGIRYVFVFENRGAEVGVTLHHPHGQVYAYPYVPPSAARLLERAHKHREATGRSMLDDLVAFELDGPRVVYRDEHWVAFVPYAARWPYELQIHPIAHRAALTELTAAEQESFAQFYPGLVRALDTIFDGAFPYMAGWLQAPAHGSAQEVADSRLFLRMITNRRSSDKLKYLAGSEALMGAFINDVPPESAAETIREAIIRADL